MKSLTDANFDTELADSTWLVVFWATWCGPCHDTQHIDEFALETPNINVGMVNVEESPDIAIANSITMVPTYLFFKKGQPTKRLSGLQSCSSLKEAMRSL